MLTNYDIRKSGDYNSSKHTIIELQMEYRLAEMQHWTLTNVVSDFRKWRREVLRWRRFRFICRYRINNV